MRWKGLFLVSARSHGDYVIWQGRYILLNAPVIKQESYQMMRNTLFDFVLKMIMLMTVCSGSRVGSVN